MRSWVPFALSALLLLSTVSAQEPGIQRADPAETTMYVHLGVPTDFPVNTQLPDDRYGVSQGKGVATATNTCVPEPVPGIARGDHHTWYSYSSPGYVQYDVDLGGKPRFHPERGLSYDIDFDTSQPVRLTWYVESQLSSGDGTDVNQVPAAVPNVVLRATLREGDEISVDHASMNTGRVIAQAQTEPALLAGPATPDHAQVTYTPVAQDGTTKHVYAFHLELPFEDPGRSPQITAAESYNLRVDLFVANGTCDDPAAQQSFMPNTVRLHSSPGHRPHFTWTVLEPIRIEALHPQFIGDDLVIHTSANSPWGNYDVRGDAEHEVGGYTVAVEGPTVPRALDLVYFGSPTGGDIVNGHDHHTEALSASYVWPYKAEGAPAGDYTVTLRVQNDQESSETVAVAHFRIGDDAKTTCVQGADGVEECATPQSTQRESPGVPLAALVAGLGALAVARRRLG